MAVWLLFYPPFDDFPSSRPPVATFDYWLINLIRRVRQKLYRKVTSNLFCSIKKLFFCRFSLDAIPVTIGHTVIPQKFGCARSGDSVEGSWDCHLKLHFCQSTSSFTKSLFLLQTQKEQHAMSRVYCHMYTVIWVCLKHGDISHFDD